jgi:hypothetical protein
LSLVFGEDKVAPFKFVFDATKLRETSDLSLLSIFPNATLHKTINWIKLLVSCIDVVMLFDICLGLGYY